MHNCNKAPKNEKIKDTMANILFKIIRPSWKLMPDCLTLWSRDSSNDIFCTFLDYSSYALFQYLCILSIRQNEPFYLLSEFPIRQNYQLYHDTLDRQLKHFIFQKEFLDKSEYVFFLCDAFFFVLDEIAI